MYHLDDFGPMDIDVAEPNEEPVCVCAEYHNAQHPVFCKACGAWTDEVELVDAELADIPALPRITTPVYQITVQEEAA